MAELASAPRLVWTTLRPFFPWVTAWIFLALPVRGVGLQSVFVPVWTHGYVSHWSSIRRWEMLFGRPTVHRSMVNCVL